MKKRALSALLCLALCFALAGQAAAAEGGVSFTVNGTPLAEDVRSYAEDSTASVGWKRPSSFSRWSLASAPAGKEVPNTSPVDRSHRHRPMAAESA